MLWQPLCWREWKGAKGSKSLSGSKEKRGEPSWMTAHLSSDFDFDSLPLEVTKFEQNNLQEVFSLIKIRKTS